MVAQINALAKTTGKQDLSPFQKVAGYQCVKDKFGVADLTPMKSDVVDPPRVRECPVQMEAKLAAVNEMNRDEEGIRGLFLGLELKILRVHAEEDILQQGNQSMKVDADRWRPLITSFQQFYGLSASWRRSMRSSTAEDDGCAHDLDVIRTWQAKKDTSGEEGSRTT